MKLPHRRLFLAGCAAAGIAAFARPGRSAEIEAHTNPRGPRSRPRAEFDAARQLAMQADTPAGVEAILYRELGPLPWYIGPDENHPYAMTVTRLSRMDDPTPGEATGVWGIARTVDPEHPEKPDGIMLIQLGRIVLKMGSPTEFRDGFERLYRETGAQRASLTYRRIGNDGQLFSAGFEDRDDTLIHYALDDEPVQMRFVDFKTGDVSRIAATPTL